MPNWVAQKRGSHVGRIDKIVTGWRQGLITEWEAWQELCELYRVVHGRYPNGVQGQEVPPRESYELHRGGYGADVAYMLTTWFPLYANVWYEGSPRNCRERARSLERWVPGACFEVFYEY